MAEMVTRDEYSSMQSALFFIFGCPPLGFPDRVKRSFFRIVRQLPIVKDKVS